MSMIIGLHGAAGSGKDEVAFAMERWANLKDISFQKISFAGPVYELASVIFGTSMEMLGERRTKELATWFTVTQGQLELANDFWVSNGLAEYADFAYIWPIFEDKWLAPFRVDPIHHYYQDALFSSFISPRRILQLIGTELGRNLGSPDIWVNTLKRSVIETNADLTIVTDIRFDDEAQIIHQIPNMSDSLVLQITSTNSPHLINTNHASEAGVSENLINSYFTNTFEGLEKLEKDVFFFLEDKTFMHI